jgi:hypothetical protein
MGLISYTLGIPDGPNNPSNDQPNMKNNNDAIDAYVSVDHVGFNNNNSGYHTLIHQIPRSTDPSPINGINQVYAKNVLLNAVTDTQLFNMTGLGIIRQLTGGNAAQFVSATNGYQYIGGILVQWGTVTNAVSRSETVVALPISFPNNNLGVFTNLQKLTSQSDVDTVYAVKFTNSQFRYYNTSASSTRTFNWIAIGN